MSLFSRVLGSRRRTIGLENQALDCLSVGDLAGARRYADLALAKAPDSPEIQHLSAKVALGERRLEAAIAHLLSAIIARPDSRGMRMDLVSAYRLSGQSVKALEQLHSILRHSPDDLEVLVALCRAQLESDRWADARETLGRIESRPDSARLTQLKELRRRLNASDGSALEPGAGRN